MVYAKAKVNFNKINFCNNIISLGSQSISLVTIAPTSNHLKSINWQKQQMSNQNIKLANFYYPITTTKTATKILINNKLLQPKFIKSKVNASNTHVKKPMKQSGLDFINFNKLEQIFKINQTKKHKILDQTKIKSKYLKANKLSKTVLNGSVDLNLNDKCFDKSKSNCLKRKKKCYIFQYYKTMQKYCAKTCGYCTTDSYQLTTPLTLFNPDFQLVSYYFKYYFKLPYFF